MSQAKKKPAARRTRRWSHKVMERSDALDLKDGVFKLEDPRAIARSLRRSAGSSKRRKSNPFRSAMSMLSFYINRAGEHLGVRQRHRLERAKDELGNPYGKQSPRK